MAHGSWEERIAAIGADSTVLLYQLKEMYNGLRVLWTPLSAKPTKGGDATTRLRKIWLVTSRDYFHKGC